jgi:hypothetical protein
MTGTLGEALGRIPAAILSVNEYSVFNKQFHTGEVPSSSSGMQVGVITCEACNNRMSRLWPY